MSTVSTVNLPVSRQTVVIQWGVFDIRTNKIIRTHLTRDKARNYARRSQYYSVVRRRVHTGFWE